jgi:uncharacterized protein YchJ
MYDNFNLQCCKIVEEKLCPDDNTATVQFIAEMILRETGEMTAFMETSSFERAKTHGAWLYKDGKIEAAPGNNFCNESGNDDMNESIAEKLANMLSLKGTTPQHE